MDLQYKSLPFALDGLKASGDKWEFSGYASTFGGSPDSYGDVVLRGAFDKTLKLRPKRKLLWQHNVDEPIGVEVGLEPDEKGLKGTWKLSKTARGSDAYELLKDGAVDSLSIGYVVEDAEWDETGVRLLKQIDLLEVSVVSIPANERALITRVKADVPFDVLLQRSTAHLTLAVDEAKALHTRRAAEGRKLSDAHLEALDALIAQAEAALALKALRTDPAPAAEAATGYRPNLALVELRLRRLGIRPERTERTA